MFGGGGAAQGGMGDVPPEFADDPELYYAMQLSLQDTGAPNEQSGAGGPG